MTVAENIAPGARLSARRARHDRLARGRRAAPPRRSSCVGCDIDPRPRVQQPRPHREVAGRDRPRARRRSATCWCSTSRRPACPADEVERLFAALRTLRDARRRHDLRLAPARRGLPHRRPRRRAARRRAGRRRAGRRRRRPRRWSRQIVGRSTFDAFAKAERADRRRPRSRSAASRTERRRAGRLRARTAASCSASSACAAPARRRSAARSFGAAPHDGAVRLDGAAARARPPARGAGAGRRARSARDRGEESVAAGADACARTSSSTRRAARRGLFSPLSPRREARGAAEIGRSVDLRPNEPERRSRRCPAATSRRSWSRRWLATGRRLLIAEDPTAGVDVGAKAEIYRLIGARARRRARRSSSSRPTSRRSRRSATARWSSTAAGSSPSSPAPALTTEAVITAASASRSRLTDGRRGAMPMNSVKSEALEPTRAELAALAPAGAAACAACRSTACRSSTVLLAHLLLAAAAADLPDHAEPPLDRRRQGDHRACCRWPR